MFDIFTSNTPDQSLVKFINKCLSQNILSPVRVPGVIEYCGTDDINDEGNSVSIYECEGTDKFTKMHVKHMMSINFRMIQRTNDAVALLGHNKLALVIYNSDGLLDVGDYIWDCLKDNEKIKRNISLIKNTLKNYRPNINLKEIMDKYETSISESTLEIFVDIIPDSMIDTNPDGLDIVTSIPKNKRVIISKLGIEYNSNGQILSVKLPCNHPNADEDGYYCIGSRKWDKLNLKNVDYLVNRIKTYNLTDCYWKPNFS
jgi:hypothetical protein